MQNNGYSFSIHNTTVNIGTMYTKKHYQQIICNLKMGFCDFFLHHFLTPFWDKTEYCRYWLFFHNKNTWQGDLECGVLTDTDKLKIWSLCLCGRSCVLSRNILLPSEIKCLKWYLKEKRRAYILHLTSWSTEYLLNSLSEPCGKMKEVKSYIVRQ